MLRGFKGCGLVHVESVLDVLDRAMVAGKVDKTVRWMLSMPRACTKLLAALVDAL